MNDKMGDDDLKIKESHVVGGITDETVHDEVFGELKEGGPNYRSVSFGPSSSNDVLLDCN